MAQKFIVSENGELRFGDVHLHRDLMTWGEDSCWGGGFWRVCPSLTDNSPIVILYGQSYDYGGADFARIRRIRWQGSGTSPCPLYYAPHYPNLDTLEPVFAH